MLAAAFLQTMTTRAEPSPAAEAPSAGYNPNTLVGSLIDDEEGPVPLLYFTSIAEAWVSPRAATRRVSMHWGPYQLPRPRASRLRLLYEQRRRDLHG